MISLSIVSGLFVQICRCSGAILFASSAPCSIASTITIAEFAIDFSIIPILLKFGKILSICSQTRFAKYLESVIKKTLES